MNADVLVVTDVFPARETPIPGITGKLVADDALAAGHRNVQYIEHREDITRTLREMVRPGDMVITFGAGDINKVGIELLEELKAQG